MLKHNEFMPFAPDVPGDKVRINHQSGTCDGSSQSMTIHMDDVGTIHAKCWRCGQYGQMKNVKPSSRKSAPKNKRRSYDLPDDIVYDWGKMPVESVVYLNKFKFSERITSLYGIGWSPKEDALIFPAENLQNGDPGWQAKYFGRKQRYSTVTRTPQDMYTHILSKRMLSPVSPSTVIITEDLLSAIRCRSRVLSSCALLGTELSQRNLNEITTFHKRFYVWLDNDNAIVDKKARHIYNTLSLYGDAILIKELQEPKELSHQEITAVLYKYHRK